MVLACSAVLGLTINHSTFLCTHVNEPLMTSVAGNLKNVLMVSALLSFWRQMLTCFHAKVHEAQSMTTITSLVGSSRVPLRLAAAGATAAG